MLCDRHQRPRLPPSCSFRRDCNEATDRCVWGLRGRRLYGHTRRSALSVTMQVAGRGSDRCGVELHYSFAELREVAFEECPTGIGELGVQPAKVRLSKSAAGRLSS